MADPSTSRMSAVRSADRSMAMALVFSGVDLSGVRHSVPLRRSAACSVHRLLHHVGVKRQAESYRIDASPLLPSIALEPRDRAVLGRDVIYPSHIRTHQANRYPRAATRCVSAGRFG